MSLKINLLKQKRKQVKRPKQRKIISGLSIFIIIIMLAGSLFTYVYYFILLRSLNALSLNIANYNSEIAKYKEVEEKKSVLNEQLSKIKNIYSKRVDFEKGIEEIESILPAGIVAKGLTLDRDGNTEMNVIASSSAEIEKFVENLKSLRERGLTKATLGKLSRDKDQSYNIGLHLEIPKKEEK